jgi:transcriptional regulator with XRE-family HTH domain
MDRPIDKPLKDPAPPQQRAGDRLRDIRKLARMTQTQFGAAMYPPWSKAMMSQAEKGGNAFKLTTVLELARVGGMPPWIFFMDVPPRPDGPA